jgi:hypothetical protein
VRNVGKYWSPVSASPRSPRYLQAASCCHTPEHVKWPLPCHVFSTWTSTSSLEAPCPYPSLSGHLITSPTVVGVPVTHVGSLGTISLTRLAV